ncbi:MAG: helix-turn-helix transcriptional regulator [Fusobacterium sp. JB021]|nr:helix-turn-helix transcriptional regulator [Fusobacterium sp. JB020]MDP0492826.1 helix-turn-helix transcriptional regulator [Fusobacterium sp. JB021]MDP0506948.1 helix-turn-helix transcriptional regulator [Fusobacterium sp. JB019]
MDRREAFKFLDNLAKGISIMFGSDCETIIHDFNTEDCVVASIYNGHVTGRKKGDKLNLLGIYNLDDMRNGKDLYNCLGKTDDGRMIKSTTFHFKDEKFHYVLGINLDFTKLSIAQKTLSDIIKTGIDVSKAINENPNEKVILEIFEEGLRKIGKPVKEMNKKERMALVKYINDNGGFSLKKSIQTVAEKMEISRYTIYNYLKEFGIDLARQ